MNFWLDRQAGCEHFRSSSTALGPVLGATRLRISLRAPDRSAWVSITQIMGELPFSELPTALELIESDEMRGKVIVMDR